MAKLKRAIAGLLIFAFVVAGLSLDKKTIPDTDLRRSIEDSEAVLEQQDLAMVPERLSVQLLPGRQHRSEQEVIAMLRANDHLDHPIYYRSNLNKGRIYTMSASGQDGRQHLVNAYLEGYAPFETENVMIPLYVLSQRKSYLLDKWNYFGKRDVWQSSRQAYYYSRGDCEDHAIILADWLITMGEDARVAIGDWGRVPHAWVVLFKDGKEYILEATKKSGLARNNPYPIASVHPEYHPKFMFNEGEFWVNRGSEYTTNYTSNAWEKRSTIWINE